MKLRLGFVTNSSSTNHVITWKGNAEDLFNIFKKYKEDYAKEFKATLEELKELANAITDFAYEAKGLGVTTASFSIGTEDDCNIQPFTDDEEVNNWDYPTRISYNSLNRFYSSWSHGINKEDLMHRVVNG